MREETRLGGPTPSGGLWMNDELLKKVFSTSFEPNSPFGRDLLNFLSRNNTIIRDDIADLKLRVAKLEAIENARQNTFFKRALRKLGFRRHPYSKVESLQSYLETFD